MPLAPFETTSVRMERRLTIEIQAPEDDVDRVMDAVVALTPLEQGPYDQCALQSAPGVERYRPRDGAAAGAESALRKRPGVVAVRFEIEDDPALTTAIVEAVFQAHSYQEPVIKIEETLVSRSKGLDDRDNPNRWWNTTGDWKRAQKPSA